MTIKTFGIGCGAVLLAVTGFVGWRVAMPWETFTFGGYEVRRNRITEKAQLKIGDSWANALNTNRFDQSAPNVPESELPRVNLSKLAFGERGYFCGVMTATGTTPIAGRLAVNITVRDTFTKRRREIESERSLRCNVSLAPGVPQTFLLQTDMTVPRKTETFEAKLVPIRAE